MNAEAGLLDRSLDACRQRVEKLQYSITKTAPLFPLTIEGTGALTEAQEESIDALILRYSQCVSMMQDQIFRGIAYIEHEETGDLSNRDRALLMEKLGAIKSADSFGTAALLRNKFSHHYPELTAARTERLNLVPIEARYVAETFDDIQQYLRRKRFGL